MAQSCRSTTRYDTCPYLLEESQANTDQHSVVPNGGLRFALTCRHILPHKVAKEDHHLGDFDVDAFPEYDGDVAKEDAKYPLF